MRYRKSQRYVIGIFTDNFLEFNPQIIYIHQVSSIYYSELTEINIATILLDDQTPVNFQYLPVDKVVFNNRDHSFRNLINLAQPF